MRTSYYFREGKKEHWVKLEIFADQSKLRVLSRLSHKYIPYTYLVLCILSEVCLDIPINIFHKYCFVNPFSQLSLPR